MAFVSNKIKQDELKNIKLEIMSFYIEEILEKKESTHSYVFLTTIKDDNNEEKTIKVEGHSEIFGDIVKESENLLFYGFFDKETNTFKANNIVVEENNIYLNKTSCLNLGLNEEELFSNDIKYNLIFKNEKLFSNSIRNSELKNKEIILKKYYSFLMKIDLLVFLSKFGINELICSHIFEYYNQKTTLNDALIKSFKNKFLENPYFLTDLPLITFDLIDNIGLNKLNISKNDFLRLKFFIKSELNDIIIKNGDTYLEYNSISTKITNKILISKQRFNEIVDSYDTKKDIILFNGDFKSIKNNKVSITTSKCITTGNIFLEEKNIIKNIINIKNDNNPTLYSKYKNIIDKKLQEDNFLYDSQKEALKEILNEKISVLTGGPGTGKTTLLKNIVDFLKEFNIDFALLSPTGKAANRISEVTKEKSSTIHRFLEYNPYGSVNYNKNNKLKEKFFIIDESSMLDNFISNILLDAISNDSQVIFVGDIDQIQPVQYGNFFKEICSSGKILVSKLTQTGRTKNGSEIPFYANEIKEGNNIVAPNNYKDFDFSFIECKSDREILQNIKNISKDLINNGYNSRNIQIITPQNKTSVGVFSLNNELKSILNLSYDNDYSFFKLQKGDKVIQNENNYDKAIFNGSIGYILNYNYDKDNCIVDFDGKDKNSLISKSEIQDLSLAYAISIHKSQGSESDIIIIPISHSHQFMLNKNLLYTAITRSKKKVILVGDLELFNKSTKKINNSVRNSLISKILKRNLE